MQTPKFHHYPTINLTDYISCKIIQHKTMLNPYRNHILLIVTFNSSVTIRMNMVIWPAKFHHYLGVWQITFLMKSYNARHYWICTQTTLYQLPRSFSVKIRMNMVIWPAKFHHYLIINKRDYISYEIIQFKTSLNLYTNYILSINLHLQCDN